MPKQVVFDSPAVLSFFQNEQGADAVRKMILDSVEGEIVLSVSAVNLGEIWYIVARKISADRADALVHTILNMPIEIVEANWAVTRQAASYKLNGGLSYADCFAAALAKLRNAELVTGDKEFKKVEKEIKISWL
jgi:predicted nucleic acid-binding protein